MLEFLREFFDPMSGVKFGEIDVSQILDNEYKIKYLLRVVEWLMSHMAEAERPTPDMLRTWQNEIIEELRRKYPNSGIELNR